MSKFSSLRVGFVPMHDSLRHPFDLRNFIYFAKKRGISFELAGPNHNYDVVVLSPRADLSVWSRYKGQAKLIFLIVDSYLAISPSDIKGSFRGLAKFIGREHKYLRLNYSRALKEMCLRSDAVVCTTPEQKGCIQEFCRNIHIILEFNSRVARDVKADYRIGNRINLVWEGQAENISGFKQIKGVLFNLSKKYPIALHLITDLERKKYMNKFKEVSILGEVKRIFKNTYLSNISGGQASLVYLYQWNLEMLSRIITGCDIAIIPLDIHNPLMRGKPENKLVSFWRMGMPAITSATPAYERAMARCGLDLCCKDNHDWMKKLEYLIVNSSERKTAGEQGKICADTIYSEEAYLKQWDGLFESVLNQ
ncbi:MAG: hypothetical protein NTY47_04555 [Candidatus Omnitrophica bacterium]|nr:hypothetical protein [Candidatus Omnitrophota bacterium]